MTHKNSWGYALIPLSNGREWELKDDYRFTTGMMQIDIPRGFVFDGASIPRVLWGLLGAPQAGRHARATLIHDYLYAKHRVRNWASDGDGIVGNINRLQADDIMLEVMRLDGVSWWRRRAIYRGVRIGGAGAWLR